jgi:hypothetical protein
MKKCFLFLVLLGSIGASFASGRHTSTITGYVPYLRNEKALLIFQLKDNPSGACNVSARFAIDQSNPHFKATQAAVMQAFHSNTPVTVLFNQTCNSWANSWDAYAVCVGNLPC